MSATGGESSNAREKQPETNEQEPACPPMSGGRLEPISNKYKPQPPINERKGVFVSRDDVSADMPTCLLSSRELKDPVLKERLDNALEHGRNFLENRPGIYMYKVSHHFLKTKDQEATFVPDLKALRKVLNYLRLRKMLEDRADIARPAFEE